MRNLYSKIFSFNKVFLKSFFILCSLLGFLYPTFAEEEVSDLAQESLEDLTLVGATGVSGAILGLSTLPFEKEPSQHLRHIIVGGSIGIIVGVAIIAWNKAHKSQEMNLETKAWNKYREYEEFKNNEVLNSQNLIGIYNQREKLKKNFYLPKIISLTF